MVARRSKGNRIGAQRGALRVRRHNNWRCIRKGETNQALLREGVGVVPGNAKMIGVARDNNRDSELLASSCCHFDAVRPNDTATSIVAVDDCARTFAAAAASLISATHDCLLRTLRVPRPFALLWFDCGVALVSS